MDIIQQALDRLRDKLLDLTYRNSLLNFSHPKKSSLRIVDELPNQIFETLASGSKMTFKPVPEPREEELIEAGYIEIDPITQERVEIKDFPKADKWADYIGIDTDYSVPENYVEDREGKHQDNLIQTLLYPSDMESHLRNVYRRTQTTLNETGANILYLCLGFLRWSDDNSRKGISPLFTIPVEITKGTLNRNKGIYEYTIKYSGEDIIENLSLREKLKRDFDLALPELEEEGLPESYFNKVSSFIKRNKPKWKVERYVTLGLLNFQKSLMYRDLDPSQWSGEHSILNNELVKQIIFGVEKEGEERDISYMKDYDIDSYGETVHKKYPLLFDADSSQHSAIIDAIDGKNIVIEGPPGTGKSQTISNLIAAALGQGKSVLFMAEKQAALNVVYEKLSTVGLQDFCLNLHSRETNKKDIIKSLERRIKSRNTYETPENYQSKINSYENLKNDLNNYVNLINSNWKDTNLSIHQILNSAAAYKKFITDDVFDVEIECSSVNKESILKSVEELESFVKVSKDIFKNYDINNEISNHSWYGFNNKNFQSYDSDNIVKALIELNTQIENYLDISIELQNKYSFFDSIKDFRSTPDICLDIDQLIDQSTSFDFDNYELIDPYKLSEYKYAIDTYSNLAQIIEEITDQIGNSDFLHDLNNIDAEVPDYLGLIDDNKTLDDIETIEKNILSLTGETENIEKIFSEINNILGGEFLEFTHTGLDDFQKIVKCVHSIPQVCISTRDPIFDDENTYELFSEFKQDFENAKNLFNKTSEIFSIDKSPDSSRLIAIKEVLGDKSIFRWLKKDYRDAKKEMVDFAANPYIKLQNLIDSIDALVKTKNKIKKINSSKYTNYFGNYINGLDTKIELIEGVINWYTSISSEFGTGFGELYKTRNALKDISDKNLLSLSKLISTNETKSIKKTGIEITECLSFCSYDKKFGAENHSIKPLLESCSVIVEGSIKFLRKIIFLASPNSTIKTFKYRFDLYQKYLKLKKHWSDIDENIYFKDFEYLKNSSNFKKVEGTIEFLHYLNNEISYDLSTHIFNNLNKDSLDNLKEDNAKIKNRFDKFIYRFNKFKEDGDINTSEWTSFDYSLKHLLSKNKNALNSIDELDDLAEYLRIINHMKTLGLDDLCKFAIKNKSLEKIVSLYKARVFDSLALEVLAETKDLASFSAKMHTQKINEFKEVDEQIKSLNIGMLQSRIDSNTHVIQGNSGYRVSDLTEMNLIRNEVSKKTRHVPLRSLISRSPKSIKSLKPCFLMSPMSVSQYLPPGKQVFDIVIMDEASQIRPEDAIGTIARGKQVIIVGDPKQLPPTNFFTRSLDDEDDDNQSILETQESILDAAIRIFSLRTLRWHYRSRHESLIAFSNHSFYDDNLIVFPSPVTDRARLGIQYKKVEQGSFVNKRNLQEASVVASAIKKHLMTSNESLGVVAMNINQVKEIESALEILAKESSDDFSSILDKSYNQAEESFFIKNLENVQGDERDVMFISLTYGGTKYFGLNQADDWRRLNVLLTRAKLRMHVFSSFSSYDVPSDHQSLGIRSLNKFLKYCETGEITKTISKTDRGPDSEFEISVMELLNTHGYDCVPQVGEAGFFIDIAVRDPDYPGEYLMGIECDGATYHSSKSARDRDRLKQQVLEGLGWNIKRIWSTDWFRNPVRSIGPILDELKNLKENNKLRHKEEVSKEGLTEHFEDKDDIENDELSSTDVQVDNLQDFDKYDWSDLENCVKTQLTNFSKIIEKEFPETDPRRRLLSPNMIKHLSEEAPSNKDEFQSEIPGYLIEVIDKKEKNKYLVTILNIINNCIDNS